MKTLLIDNGSTLTEKLALLSPGDEHVVDYGNIPINLEGYSLIILSGSSKFPVVGNEELLKEEIQLILETNIPVVGICFGHELIAHAFGGTVTHLGKNHKGIVEVNVVENHQMFGDREEFSVYENHQFGIIDTPKNFQKLAETEHSIAIMKHDTKAIYGFQFHPEHLTDKQFGDEIFLNLFRDLTL